MRKSLSLLFLSAALLIFGCAKKKETPFTLISARVPCAIVVDLGPFDNAEEAAASFTSVDWQSPAADACRRGFAALELRNHLAALLDIDADRIPIINQKASPPPGNFIFLGLPTQSKWKKIARRARSIRSKSDGDVSSFRFDTFISNDRQGLVISSGSSIGELYAVYHLLEKFGVRWFFPGSDGCSIPKTAAIVMEPTHEQVKPALADRGLWFEPSRAQSVDDDFIRWMGRNRLNLFTVQSPNIPLLKLFGFRLSTGERDLTATLLTPDRPYRYNHPVFVPDQHLPIDPYLLSEEYKGDADGDGRLSFAEAHPEWFRVSPDSVAGQGSIISFCPSQADAVKEFARIIADELASGLWRNVDIVDLWEPQVWCACPACKAQTNKTDMLLTLAHAVDEEIERRREAGQIQRAAAVFVYSGTGCRRPPSRNILNSADRSLTFFLSAWPRCFSHYIIETECVNINLWFIKDLLDWLNKKTPYSGRLGVVEYYGAESFLSLPTLHSKVMGVDLSAYAQLGLSSAFFMNPQTSGSNALQNYLFSKSAWKPSMSLDSLRAEYLHFAFAGAEKQIDRYFTALENCLSTITTWAHYLPLRVPLLLQTLKQNPADLPTQVNEQFDRLHSRQEPEFNSAWERSYSLAFETRYLLEDAAANDLSPAVRERITELMAEQQYLELMVSTFDNLVTLFTCAAEEEERRTEAIYRLRENRRKISDAAESTFFIRTAASNKNDLTRLIDLVLQENAHR